MKLLGAEINTFACFEKQFVPLRQGIGVLVGKNNAGKTAILRALSALRTLPFGPTGPSGQRNVPTPLDGYMTKASPTGFVITLFCRIDEYDAQYFTGVSQQWLEKAYQEGLAKWTIRVDAPGRCTVTECNLSVPGNVLGLFTGTKDGGSMRTRFGADFKPATAAIIQWSNSFFAPIADLSNVRLVSPHRVVADSQSLQTADELPTDARNLAPFLQTLHGQNRAIFNEIEAFVLTVFPEFSFVNAANGPNNQIGIDFTEKSTYRRIPLANCGTGVEQILTLATFVLMTTKPGLILLDEPHSYLHPSAERELLRFLEKHSEHRYLISTHSAVLMNSVDPDRITVVAPPGQPYEATPGRTEMSRILFDLGYRNSDSLFHDRLVIVEGKSDAAILPILLRKAAKISDAELNRTAFPSLGGVGTKSTGLQTSIDQHEKLLLAVGRARQPRIYLLDGDRNDSEKVVLEGTRSFATKKLVEMDFLPRLEIENYLLVPEAIHAAICEEMALVDSSDSIELAKIQNEISSALAGNDRKLFPQGKVAGRPPEEQIKGSLVLSKLYDDLELRHHKERSGALIARYISPANQPAIGELVELVKSVFGVGEKTGYDG